MIVAPTAVIAACAGLLLSNNSALAGSPVGSTGASGATGPVFSPQPVQNLANAINGLRQNTYPQLFTGVSIDASGDITVYVPAAQASAELQSAVEGAVSASRLVGVTITFVNVGVALASLNALSVDIQQADYSLIADGVNIGSWTPVPSLGTMQVTLNSPTNSDLSNLAANLAEPAGAVTPANYASSANEYLQKLYGAEISAVPPASPTSGPVTDSGRTTDTPRFTAGDNLHNNGGSEVCTSGWPVEGASTSTHFYSLTAGHCGDYTFDVGKNYGTFFGNTATIYKRSSAGTDVQTVDYGSSAPWEYEAQVWNGGTGSNVGRYAIEGINASYPAKGTGVYYDGSVTGESAPDAVDGGGADTCVNFDTGKVCNLVETTLQDTNGQNVTHGGDSGGPVFTLGPNGVFATGLIEGEDIGTGYAWNVFLCADNSITHTVLFVNSAASGGGSTAPCVF